VRNIYSSTGLQEARQYFDDALLKYGRTREEICAQTGTDPVAYVGQFIDREGVLSRQHGIYGMSAWLTLTRSTVPEADQLRVSCRDALKQWIEASRDDDVINHPDDNRYELRFVIPKICYAYRAMMAVGCEDAGRILLGYIQQACREGSWGYLTSSEQGDACMTALVVRTFRGHANFTTSPLPQSLRFLHRHYYVSKNPCLRLYVLNTLRLSDPNNRLLPDVNLNELIREQIRMLHTDIQNNPLSVSNPVTIHFSDDRGHRLRYYRFPGDLIVLESLLLISRPHVRLYPHQLGRHIGGRLGRILDGADDLALDTCNDRMSFPTCLYISDVLDLLSDKVGGPERWVYRFAGAVASMFTFQPEAKAHLIGLLTCVVLLAAVYWWSEEVFKVLLGGALVEVIYMVREVYTWRRGERRSEES
jgi:hypothetical protein